MADETTETDPLALGTTALAAPSVDFGPGSTTPVMGPTVAEMTTLVPKSHVDEAADELLLLL